MSDKALNLNPVKLQTLISALEQWAPKAYAEEWDNVGLLLEGDQELIGCIVALDVTLEVVQEAIAKGANVIVAHHPIIFKGVKQLTKRDPNQAATLLAARHGISIYAAHTNLDSVATGVSQALAQALGLQESKILSLREGLSYKVAVMVLPEDMDKVRAAMFQAGAGRISTYDECSYVIDCIGTFRPLPGANPAVGTAGGLREEHREQKVEFVVSKPDLPAVLAAMKHAHPYEVPAFEVVELVGVHPEVGLGMIGNLPMAMPVDYFYEFVKNSLGLKGLRATYASDIQEVSKVAVCGGSGSFLTKAARAAGAHAYITADIKYHEAFDAGTGMTLVDIGHYESEYWILPKIVAYLQEKIPNFAVHLTGINTNPVRFIA